MAPFIIRKIKAEDAAGFRVALDSVARERRFLIFLEAPPLDEVEAFIERNLQRDYPQVVAESEGRIVGWADFIPTEREGLRHCASLGMGVIRSVRRRGIGEALLAQAIELAAGKGLTRLELEVFSNNIAAKSLYRKLGFVQEGTRTKAMYIDGQYWDMDIMAKLV